jgi:hypothetical protein
MWDARAYAVKVTGRTFAVVVLLAFTPLAAVASGGNREVVLGKRNLTGRYGIGWGTAHPPVIYNGGVPSGKAWNLRWSKWGAARGVRKTQFAG